MKASMLDHFLLRKDMLFIELAMINNFSFRNMTWMMIDDRRTKRGQKVKNMVRSGDRSFVA